MQLLESGLKVKEYELLRRNFSDTGALVSASRSTLILESSMILPLVFTAWTSMLFWNALGTVLVVVAGASHALAFIRELQRMTR
ncbi:hypothetical protein BDE02_11G056600 [Populus trichocarpa]|nr:hypothetical protein BDE02_11G056600 [Populus trichocarpa]